MISPDLYLTLIQFYYDNKDVITDSSAAINLDNIVITDDTSSLDSVTINLAIYAKQNTLSFFNRVIDLPAFSSEDYTRLKAFLVDWYSANRTIIDMKQKGSDPHAMTDELLDIAFRSLGYDYASIITDKETRVQFFLELVNLYKKKGTPSAIIDVLKFYGLEDISIYEWWLIRRKSDGELYFKGKLLNTGETTTQFPSERYIQYENFPEIISDPHWYYEKDQIKYLDDISNGNLTLPSLTPYFSIAGGSNLRTISAVYSILNKLLYSQYQNYIYGQNVPSDIFIDSYGKSISLLSLYTGILYSYHRFNDYCRYTALRDYLYDQFPTFDPETDSVNPFTFRQPYAYERLLLWCINRTDENGNPQYLDILASGWNQPVETTVIEYTEATGGWVYPKENKAFNLYPMGLEKYSTTVPTGSLDPSYIWDFDIPFSSLNPDLNKTLIPFDQKYVDVGISIQMVSYLKQLFANDFTSGSETHSIPDYNTDITNLTDLKNEVTSFIDKYEEITDRPSSYDDAVSKRLSFEETFSRFQNLDFIQNRFDPERLMLGRGRILIGQAFPSNPSIGDNVLVCGTEVFDPEVYEWDGSAWNVKPDGLTVGYLGIDPDLINWIESSVGADKYAYGTLASTLLTELDSFIATYIYRMPISVTQLLSSYSINDDIIPVIDFFKPKKARFLTLELVGTISESVPDSINIKDEVEITVEEVQTKKYRYVLCPKYKYTECPVSYEYEECP